ncbi:DNA-binding protein, partial [Escherichia coli]|nr:DNA-binding protein [Escherichia coli]
KKVAVQIEPVYSGDSLRPSYFDVTYKIGSRKEISVSIKNQPGG